MQALNSFALPRNMLNSQKATVLCFLFAAICKVLLIHVFFSFSHDLILQGLAARSMAEGHGFTIPQVHAANLSKLVYDPLQGWPPAFSAAIVPFYFLLNRNIEAASLVAICTFAVLFIPLAGKLLKQLEFPTWVINLFILFYGLSIPQYLEAFSATDQPALMCYMLVCCQLLLFTKRPDKSGQYGILIGISCALSVWFRYMYLPVSFVLPVLLLWNGCIQKDKHFKKAGLYALAINLILVGLLLLFEYLHTGSAAYYRPAERGFFLSNLRSVNPFVLTTFTALHFYTMKLSWLLHIPYLQSRQIITVIGFIPALYMICVFCKYALRKKLTMGGSLQTFFIAGGLISFSCVILLLCLTVAFNSYYGFPSNLNWVYGAEERYFIVPVFCLQVTFLWWLFVRHPVKNYTITNICRVLFLLIVLVELLHGATVIGKYAKGHSPRQSAIDTYQSIHSFLKNTAIYSTQQQCDLVIGSQEAGTQGQATLAGIKELPNMYEVINTRVYCERPTLLVLVVRNAHLPYFKNFLDTHNALKQPLLANEYNVFYCYLAAGEH